VSTDPLGRRKASLYTAIHLSAVRPTASSRGIGQAMLVCMSARFFALLATLSLAAACANTPKPIEPDEASAHIGEQAQVCGVVANAKFAAKSDGKPTFLNLGEPFPHHVFTAVVWGSDRSGFSYPPESLEGERICVLGKISEYRGKPQVVVSRPSQITRPPTH
jgi:micrococcal nuclease